MAAPLDESELLGIGIEALVLGNAKLYIIDIVSSGHLAEVEHDTVHVVVAGFELLFAQIPVRSRGE